MKLIDAQDSVVVIVDLQARLLPAIHEGGRVVERCVRLARIARLLGVPVVGTEQNPAGLGPNVEAIRALCDPTLAKTSFDACADGLAEALPAGRGCAIVAGCEAHVCMLQTALGLLARGLSVRVVADCVGSRAPRDRDLALGRLGAAGAGIVTLEMVAFEWMRRSDHPRFREVLALVK